MRALRIEIVSVCRLADSQRGASQAPASRWGEVRLTPPTPPALPHLLCRDGYLTAGRVAHGKKLPCLQGNEQRLPPWQDSAGTVINYNFAIHCISLFRPARSISLRSVKAASVAHALPGSGNANSFPSEVCSVWKIHIHGQHEANRI